MIFHPRERWPIVVGAVLATLFLLVFGVFGFGRDFNIANKTVIGIRIATWGMSIIIFSMFLILQLLVHGRDSLHRERRLVQTAAALREATAQLERQATTDPLTSLMNRRAFFERFGVEFRRSVRYGRPLSVVMLDLDDFKLLNDRWGHPFGDYVLTEVARVIAANVRESDVVARYGGEEFVLLLPETTREAAARVAEKLRAAVDTHQFRAVGVPPRDLPAERITISGGVTSSPASAVLDSDELINRADSALYRAKRAGKNRVVVDDGTPVVVAPSGGI